LDIVQVELGTRRHLLPPAAAEIVHYRHFMALPEKGLSQMGADEARPPVSKIFFGPGTLDYLAFIV
jgi:hypothetical protein